MGRRLSMKTGVAGLFASAGTWLYSRTPAACVTGVVDAAGLCLDAVGLTAALPLGRLGLCWGWAIFGFVCGFLLCCCCGACCGLGVYSPLLGLVGPSNTPKHTFWCVFDLLGVIFDVKHLTLG